MFSWLGLLKAVVSLATVVVSFLRDKRLMTAGAALEANRNLSRAMERIEKARAARHAASADPDSLSDDGFKRD